MSAPVERLPFDSRLFGIPIARVTATRLDEPALEAALDACRAQRIRCAYLLLDGDDARGAALAQAAGFVLRDVRVELDRPIAAHEAGDRGGLAAIREDPDGALEALARAAFAGTRFAVDPGFPPERCGELYAAFLRRGLDGDATRTTLATPDGRGFIVCHRDGARGVGTIELVAVAAAARGRGLGGELVGAAIETFARGGLARAEVVTQAANVPAQRLYQRAGFRTARTGLWFHRWFDLR